MFVDDLLTHFVDYGRVSPGRWLTVDCSFTYLLAKSRVAWQTDHTLLSSHEHVDENPQNGHGDDPC